MGDEIERLRAKRGEEEVKFAQVADHLRDFTDMGPDDGDVIQRLAGFLADVEDQPHDHDADRDHGLG